MSEKMDALSKYGKHIFNMLNETGKESERKEHQAYLHNLANEVNRQCEENTKNLLKIQEKLYSEDKVQINLLVDKQKKEILKIESEIDNLNQQISSEKNKKKLLLLEINEIEANTRNKTNQVLKNLNQKNIDECANLSKIARTTFDNYLRTRYGEAKYK